MTIEDEAKAAAEKRFPREPDENGPLSGGYRAAYAMGYRAGSSRPTGETFDENTMLKVYGTLEDAMGLDHQFVVDAINAMQNAGILFRERSAEPAPVDEREALAELIDSMYDDYAPTYNREGACCGSNIADAILTSDVWRNRHPQIIPIYAMLDVWMALHDTSHPEFDEFYAEYGYAEAWARLMHAIRHPQPTEGEPSDAGIEEASRIMYEDEREWYGTAKWPHWDDADEMTKREMRRAVRAALRAARVADQEGENR